MAQRTPIKIPMEAEPEAGRVSVPSKPPISLVRRPAPVTNALLLGQQLADALGAAQALINRTPSDPAVMVDELGRWYYTLHPDERERLLWQRFAEAKQTHARLEHAIKVSRGALDVERSALVQAQAEHEALAIRRLPATVEEEATNARSEAVLRYQSLSTECQQRAAALTELERLLPAPEQALGLLTEAVTRVLEAVGTVDREAIVRRLREAANWSICALGLNDSGRWQTLTPQRLTNGASEVVTQSAPLGSCSLGLRQPSRMHCSPNPWKPLSSYGMRIRSVPACSL